MLRRYGKWIVCNLFLNRGRGSMPGKQGRFNGQSQDVLANRLQMRLIQRGGVRPPNGPGEERIADKTQRPRVPLDPIAHAPWCMTRCGHASDPEGPNRNRLFVSWRTEQVARWRPREQRFIGFPKIHGYSTVG